MTGTFKYPKPTYGPLLRACGVVIPEQNNRRPTCEVASFGASSRRFPFDTSRSTFNVQLRYRFTSPFFPLNCKIARHEPTTRTIPTTFGRTETWNSGELPKCFVLLIPSIDPARIRGQRIRREVIFTGELNLFAIRHICIII